MKLRLFVASRPTFIFILFTIGVLLFSCVVVPWWYKIIQRVQDEIDLNDHIIRSALLTEVENIAKLLHPINSSAINLARILTSSLNGSDFSQSDIQNKVAPLLFQTFSVIPEIWQISYIGLEGPSFAYYREGNRTFAMYSNSTASSNSSVSNGPMKYTWHKQPVDPNTGKLYGDATESRFYIMVNASWIQEALNSANGYASLGNGWNSDQDVLFLNSVIICGQGVVSLGFPVKALVNFFSGINLFGGSFYLATQHGDVLADGLPDTQMVVTGKSVSFNLMKPIGDQIDHIGDVSCITNNGMPRPSVLIIGEIKYKVYCLPLEIVGVQSVYAVAFPYHGLVGTVHRSTKIALILLIAIIAAVFISILSFVLLMARAATREMRLCSALIKQMEATQQAERKSLNKSLAFASASHDIRAALSGITGLIELSYEEVSPGSELETNLRQMDDCAKDLIGLLNSILDTSKIEAGKMQVESDEFDLSRLLEDLVDLFHPVGMKKGIDVMLDPCDGSVLKFSHVNGDKGKLKQVLCNLLSNAVKFTAEGHVSVRAWAKKPSLENKIIASNQNSWWKYFLCWFTKKKEDTDMEVTNLVKQNPNCMEFVFEVDDTGKGIPKEKQKSVFENFVQVKETSHGHGGTGLGLGIVQSLVRLMGGEIEIVDKENGERGTCFRFNIFLIISAETPLNRSDIEMGSDSKMLTLGAHHTPSLTIRASSPRLSMLSSSPKIDGSHVVLLIQNAERRRIVWKFMETLGIKVSVASKWEHLHSILTKIKSKQNVSPCSSSGKSDFGSRTEISGSRSKDVPLSALDGKEQRLSPHRSTSIFKGTPSFILLVIDANAGPFQEIYGAVSEFKRGLNRACCKVVWFDKPISRSIQEEMIDPNDDILLKPFHGSRLYQVIKLLPEFGGTLHHGVASSKPRKECMIPGGKAVKGPRLSSTMYSYGPKESAIPSYVRQGDMFEECSSKREKHRKSRHYPARKHSVEPSEIEEEEEYGNQSHDKPLCGLRFLVAEDNPFLRKIAMINLSRLGASVELCQNGEEALQLVRLRLRDQRRRGAFSIRPYDYILMDCEMPIMNGYEATQQIRKEERSYDVHIPIIALTAHTAGDEGEKTREAGMDICMCKPLETESLLEAIRYIHNK